MQTSELKSQEMKLSSSGKKKREILMAMSLGSISSGLKSLARFVFSTLRKVTKATTDAS